MTAEAAIYLETRPRAGADGNRPPMLVFRSAAGGSDAIGGTPVAGGDVRRRRLPIDPADAPGVWQRMKRDAEQALRAVGQHRPQAPAAAVASALAAAGLDPRAYLAPETKAALSPDAADAPTQGEEGARLVAALAADGPDPMETVLLRPPETMTDDDVRQVMRARMGLPPGDPRAAELFAIERRYFDHAYGDVPVALDETGRPMLPIRRPDGIAADSPPATPTGESLDAALARAVAPLAAAADRDGVATAVRSAQAGLNLLDTSASDGRRLLDAPLKEDGDPGPKTRAALTRAVARLGAAKVNEAIALARLRQAADRAARVSAGSDLADVARDALSPLFRSPLAPAARAIENEVLQETLNAFGATPPLVVDGDLGPKTEAAFRHAARQQGPDTVARQIGDALGLGQA